MTNLTLKNASIISQTGDTVDGMYEITLRCPMTCVSGKIQEVFGLDVEIKKNTE